jgi:hypothetical protein
VLQHEGIKKALERNANRLSGASKALKLFALVSGQRSRGKKSLNYSGARYKGFQLAISPHNPFCRLDTLVWLELLSEAEQGEILPAGGYASNLQNWLPFRDLYHFAVLRLRAS